MSCETNNEFNLCRKLDDLATFDKKAKKRIRDVLECLMLEEPITNARGKSIGYKLTSRDIRAVCHGFITNELFEFLQLCGLAPIKSVTKQTKVKDYTDGEYHTKRVSMRNMERTLEEKGYAIDELDMGRYHDSELTDEENTTEFIRSVRFGSDYM